MTISGDDKAGLVFKKVATGKATAAPAKKFFEEPVNSRSSIFTDQVWKQSDSIPDPAPSVTEGVVEIITDLVLTAIGGTPAAYTDPSLKDIIPFNFGATGTYNYSLKTNAGDAIPPGLNDWFLDPEGGVLTFFAGNPAGVSAGLPPKISCYKYIGPKGVGGGGSVSSVTAGETIAIGDAVRYSAVDTVLKSDASTFNNAAVDGIALTAATIGGGIDILVGQGTATITLGTPLVPTKRYYLSLTSGRITDEDNILAEIVTSGNVLFYMGKAKTTEELNFQPQYIRTI